MLMLADMACSCIGAAELAALAAQVSLSARQPAWCPSRSVFPLCTVDLHLQQAYERWTIAMLSWRRIALAGAVI